VWLPLLAVALTPASAVPPAWAPFFTEVTFWDAIVPKWVSERPSVAQTVAAGLSSPLAPLSGFFIQYDINCGNLALVIWAAYQYRAALPSASLVGLVLKSLIWLVIGGPAAVATVLLWERDEAVLSAPVEKKRK
jgi:hypothetical protein